MGLFGSIRNMLSGEHELQEYWHAPQTEEEVDELIEASKSDRPQIIYKHSYRCSISLFVKSSLDAEMDEILHQTNTNAYLVDVVGMRSVSNYIAQKTGIQHQSPQLILLHNGSPFWSASHGNVRAENLKSALNDLRR